MARFSLDDILKDDPLDLLEDVKVKNPVVTADDRLTASFEEINLFYQEHKKEPSKNADMTQRGLYARLEGIRNNPSKIEALKKYDRFNLLVDKTTKKVNSIDEIFENDPLGLLENTQDEDIFTLKNLPKIEKDRAEADFVAKREKFKDFEKYEKLFIDCQADLKAKRRELVPSVESQLDIGTFCVLDGVLLYIADIKDGYRGNSGKINRRTTLIFENGTKSNMLLRSLGKRLKDSGKMVTKLESEKEKKLFAVTDDDKQNGYIYILKSLSTDDRIATKRNLYKIGFSTTSVEQRIQNAKDDPTYLMADVKIVSAYEVYNVNPHKLEQLIHQFFGNSCLDIDIVGENGKVHRPREWFIAPLNVIEEAIELIINGNIVLYKYDSLKEEIVSR